MKTRNSVMYALGLAAAMTIGVSVTADAQRRATPQRRIPVRKDVPVQQPPRADTVTITRVDTVTVRRTDTVSTTVMRYDTVTRMVYPPLQRLPGFFFGLGAGANIPMNNIRAAVHDGPVGQAQVGTFFGMSPIGIRADVTYGSLPARETDCRTCESPQMLTVGGDLIMRFPLDRTSKLNPVIYALAGGGYVKFQDVDPRQTAAAGGRNGANFRSEGNLYYDVGPGIDINIGGLKLYAEGRYMTVNSGNSGTFTDQRKIHLFPVYAGIKIY